MAHGLIHFSLDKNRQFWHNAFIMKLTLTRDEALAILDGDRTTYVLISDDIVDHQRWSVVHSIIIERKSDNKFFRGWYNVGATESQDESPWEYDAPVFDEVIPVEKTIIEYVKLDT